MTHSSYMSSGNYDRDLEEICRDTLKKLATASRNPDEGVPTVIFDIDDTLLSSDPTRIRDFISQLTPETREGLGEGFLPPVDQVIALYKALRKAYGYRTVLLTGRLEMYRAMTDENLRRVGVTGYDRLILREPYEENLPARIYKTARRGQLARQGYRIVASIGDQMSDIEGPHTGLAVKLPNSRYTVH